MGDHKNLDGFAWGEVWVVDFDFLSGEDFSGGMKSDGFFHGLKCLKLGIYLTVSHTQNAVNAGKDVEVAGGVFDFAAENSSRRRQPRKLFRLVTWWGVSMTHPTSSTSYIVQLGTQS